MKTPIKYLLGIAILVALTLAGSYIALTDGWWPSGRDGEAIARSCHDLARGSEVQCWQDALESILREKGVDAAFQAVSDLYAAEPRFAPVCYSTLMRVGETAAKHSAFYQEFIRSPKSIFCNYGFYHAFAETLARTKGNLNEARRFCDDVGEQLAAASPGAMFECYRGLGRGTVNPPPEHRGDARAMARSALHRCEAVSGTEGKLASCVSGAFNQLGIFYTSGEYGLSVKKADPLWLCREQPERYQPNCYGNMHRVLASLAGGERDFGKAAVVIGNLYGKNSSQDRAVLSAIWYVAYNQAAWSITKTDHAEDARTCHALAEPFRLPCIGGFAVGLAKNGTPGRQFIAVVDFCRQVMLSEEERSGCFQYTLPYLGGLYPREKFNKICSALEERYQQFCQNEYR